MHLNFDYSVIIIKIENIKCEHLMAVESSRRFYIRPLRTGFRPSVHLRPHFYIAYGPSSECVREVNGLCSSAVHLRPSRTNDHSIYRPNSSMKWTVHRQKIVHVNILMLVQRPNSTMRWTICARILILCPRVDGPQTVVFVRGGLFYISIRSKI